MSSISIERNIGQPLPLYADVAFTLDESEKTQRIIKLSVKPSVMPSAKQSSQKYLFTTIALWLQRAQQRKQLTQLDKYQLDDLGLTAKMVAKESAKPFWK